MQRVNCIILIKFTNFSLYPGWELRISKQRAAGLFQETRNEIMLYFRITKSFTDRMELTHADYQQAERLKSRERSPDG